ncbi:hypothetical protein ACROYT_G038502 [Oculina patagonica]
MMAVNEENWQTKRSTILERTTYIFNNELLSDVKFVVPVSTGESESKMVIPAHKFVLAISSPVFFAMFYGQMAETTDSIELPDCDYEKRSFEREGIKVELFKAVDRWAIKESERQGITPDGGVKRRILGEEIVKAIRFPLMPQKEFASVVFDSYILTFQEVGDMMKHYNGVLTSSLPYKQTPRIAPIYRCSRFVKFFPAGGPSSERSNVWDYSRPDASADCINLTVNKPMMLHGVEHFGSQGGEYTVSTEVKDAADGSSLVKQSGSYASGKDETHSYYGFVVRFDRPVCLVENKEYQFVSLIKGPKSWYGTEGQASVECQGVRFTFRTSAGSSNGTYETTGQFPALLFSNV